LYLSDTDLKASTRWAVENILESESLTADLPDAEAKRLLEWGTAQARRLAAEAPELLDEKLTALRKLMRGMNKLAAETRPVEDERLRRRLERLLGTAGELGLVHPGVGAADVFVAERHGLTAGEKLERLLAWWVGVMGNG